MNTIKKHFCILLAALFACSICACSSSQEPEMQQAAPYQAPMEPPPDGFSFRSIDELRAFVSSIQMSMEMSEEDFESYAKSDSMLCSNNINSKADLNNLVDELNRIPFPKVDESQVLSMNYRPYFNDSRISIDLGNGRSCSFSYVLDARFDSEGLKALQKSCGSLSMIDSIRSAYISNLCILNDVSEISDIAADAIASHNGLVFFADINGACVRIDTREFSRAEAEELISSLEFGKLLDIIGK